MKLQTKQNNIRTPEFGLLSVVYIWIQEIGLGLLNCVYKLHYPLEKKEKIKCSLSKNKLQTMHL